jgi:radical SAM superfamily enzyme YgiQ (UPF0313 family)
MIDWSCYLGTASVDSSPQVFPIRGCPYDCSYCFNFSMRSLYKGKGRYLRRLSPPRVILEIKEALKVFKPRMLAFTSDTFGDDLKWMEELFTLYKAEIDLPFTLLLRPELTSERCVEIISTQKIHAVAVGVESGSERVRREVLKRRYSNAFLVEVADRLHRHNIPFRTYNMIGLPTETEDEMWETVDINVAMRTDYPRAAIFTPMPKTPIIQLAIDEGYLDHGFSFESIPTSILSHSVLKKLNHARIQNTLNFFHIAVLFPRLRKPLRWLTRFPPNLFFRVWFYLVYLYLFYRLEKKSVLSFVRYVWANARYD